jgi:hypothetical protein
MISPPCVPLPYKLHATLIVYTPYEARYVYVNTPDRRSSDPLRKLVAYYVASQKRIAASGACRELVVEGGAFAGDLLALVLEQMD